MFTALRTNSTTWITGTILALGGGCLVRFVVPALEPGRVASVLAASGHLLGLVGLAVICLGVSRRLKRESAAFTESVEAPANKEEAAEPSVDKQAR